MARLPVRLILTPAFVFFCLIMHRFCLFLWFFLPISCLPNGTGGLIIAQISQNELPAPDSLQYFIEKKDALEVLKKANALVHVAPERARAGFDAALYFARANRDAPLESSVLRDAGLFFEELGRLDSAYYYYEKSLLLADSLKNKDGQLTIYNDLAIICRKLERFKLSKKYHLAALDLARLTGDEEMVEFSWHGLGALYEIVGDSAQALFFYEESQKTAKKRGNISGQLITLQNLARTYAGLHRQAEAEENISQAIKLGENQPDILEFANVLTVAGDVAETFGQLEKAAFFYEKSHGLYESLHEFGEALNVRIKLAAISAEKQDPVNAINIYQECLMRTDLMGPEKLAQVYLELGRLFTQEKQFENALRMLLSGVQICETNDLMEASVPLLRACHDLFAVQKQAVKAFYYLKKAQSRTDSLAGFVAERANLALQFRYDQEQNEQSLEQLRQRKNGLLLFGVLIGGLFLVGGLGWIIFIRRRANAALKLKNEEIEEQNVRLRESNSFLQQFTYAVAHDLKAPLRTVGSFIKILDTKFGSKFPPAAHEYMNFVTVGVRQMDLLIRDLLEYSRISSQRPGTDLIDPKNVLTAVFSRLQPTILEKNAVLEIADGLPSIHFEESHLVILFQNLISNALKFNRSEPPKIYVGGSMDGGFVRYFIEDNGIGIDPEHGKKIFELFHKLHKNKGFDGTGIGLTVCKNIIDKYEGKIWFEPVDESQGTRFFVEFRRN